MKTIFYGIPDEKKIEKCGLKAFDAGKELRKKILEVYKNSYNSEPEMWIEWDAKNDKWNGFFWAEIGMKINGLLLGMDEVVFDPKSVMLKYVSEQVLIPNNMVIKDLDFIKGE